jgi:hypothetical protein
MQIVSKCLIAAAAAGAAMIVSAGAAPIAAPSALQQAVAATADVQVQTVQWRRGWRGGYRRGGGGWIGPAIVGSAIIGGAIAATRPYGYGYGYYGNPGYYGDYAYEPGYTYVEPGYRVGGSVAYCEQRFRSYDRASGTYMGYDGMRHPCP